MKSYESRKFVESILNKEIYSDSTDVQETPIYCKPGLSFYDSNDRSIWMSTYHQLEV